MILRVILKNFLSFDNEVQFDMFPNMKRTHLQNHIYTSLCDIPVLKQAAVFGPNGSGKSNLVKALEFVRAFVIDKNFISKIDLQKFFYLLKEDAMEEPLCIAIEFEFKKQFFFYEIEIAKKHITKECLWETFPLKGMMEIVFERKKNNIRFAESADVDGAIVEATKKLVEKNKMASVMALNSEFPIIPDKRCRLATNWFASKLEIIGVFSFMPTLIELLRKNDQMMDFVHDLVYLLGVGVDDVNLNETDFDQWAQKHIELANSIPDDIRKVKSLSLNANNKPVLSINIEDGVRKVYQLIFDNIGKDGFVGKLDTSSQSDGTLRVLTLLPALYFAAKQGKTVVVDEINCCLSSNMVKGIVEYFAGTNDTNGQLIFTTHDEQLLEEKNILRSDEIWFVDKHEGASVIYSHNDFKEHHTISTLKGYKEGRYGAIRYVKLLQQNG